MGGHGWSQADIGRHVQTLVDIGGHGRTLEELGGLCLVALAAHKYYLPLSVTGVKA